MNKGNLYIISAPSGAGKTSLVKEVISSLNSLSVSVSHTTRQKREGEIDGKDYFFISVEKFKMMQVDSAFLESAQVFDNFYGTAQKTVEDTLLQGNDVILEIDWQGAQQIRKLLPTSISIFILPPSIETLRQRLEWRGKDNAEIIARRMHDAVTEMRHYSEFDYVVVNEDFGVALNELKSIVIANRLVQARQSHNLNTLLTDLLL
ncbi:guanylate kinase [Methylococcaceae bacterium]|nr:guanylate kinase [Methylococcaceae bacterium]